MSKDLSQTAYDHLWMHFTDMSSYENAPVPTIVRGEGTYIYDDKGKRYLDGLSGLFVVNAATAATSWRRPRTSRRRSWPSSRSGRTPTRRPSSWPSASRTTRPAT